MAKCSSSCKTRNHATYGECLRAKNVRVADVNYTAASQKQKKELGAYEAARRQGIQPESTRKADIDKAVRVSDQTGKAYRADAE